MALRLGLRSVPISLGFDLRPPSGPRKSADELKRQHGRGRGRPARDRLATEDITLADTEFEFGWMDGQLILIDEMLTHDSTRFLISGPDGAPVAMDKQFVRDWAMTSGWNREPPAPPLPAEVVLEASRRLREITQRILGEGAAL